MKIEKIKHRNWFISRSKYEIRTKQDLFSSLDRSSGSHRSFEEVELKCQIFIDRKFADVLKPDRNLNLRTGTIDRSFLSSIVYLNLCNNRPIFSWINRDKKIYLQFGYSKYLAEPTKIFGWINQNNWYNKLNLTKKFCSVNRRFYCPYNNHIL